MDGKNESQGGTLGVGIGSGSISLSKDKMHSNYDSVQELRVLRQRHWEPKRLPRPCSAPATSAK
ncbi:hypothetical protein ACUTSW_18140 [Serratia sp. TSA_198.1]|uniref:hypothetical protein n=1 Tax=Serratia sp. TSA_198.1 TaxID=3415664 RepID=UPI0040456D98